MSPGETLTVRTPPPPPCPALPRILPRTFTPQLQPTYFTPTPPHISSHLSTLAQLLHPNTFNPLNLFCDLSPLSSQCHHPPPHLLRHFAPKPPSSLQHPHLSRHPTHLNSPPTLSKIPTHSSTHTHTPSHRVILDPLPPNASTVNVFNPLLRSCLWWVLIFSSGKLGHFLPTSLLSSPGLSLPPFPLPHFTSFSSPFLATLYLILRPLHY